MEDIEKLIHELVANANQRKELLDELWTLEELNSRLRIRLMKLLRQMKKRNP